MGTYQEVFFPVSGDPIADLLNVPRNANNSVPFNLKLIVDTTNVPYVENDTSILQQDIYRDAIISGELDLNGTKFKTLRRPLAFASETPPANNTPFDESRINITN